MPMSPPLLNILRSFEVPKNKLSRAKTLSYNTPFSISSGSGVPSALSKARSLKLKTPSTYPRNVKAPRLTLEVVL